MSKRVPNKIVSATKYSAQDVTATDLSGIKAATSEEFRRIQSAIDNVAPKKVTDNSTISSSIPDANAPTDIVDSGISGITVYSNDVALPILKKVQGINFNSPKTTVYGGNTYNVVFDVKGYEKKTDYKQSNDGKAVEVSAKVFIPNETKVVATHNCLTYSNQATTGEAQFNLFSSGGDGYLFVYGAEEYPGLPFDKQTSESNWEVVESPPLYGGNNYGIYTKLIVPEDGVYQIDAFFSIVLTNIQYEDINVIPLAEQLFRPFPDLKDKLDYYYVLAVERDGRGYLTLLGHEHFVPSVYLDYPDTVGLTYNGTELTLNRTLEYGFKKGDKVSFQVGTTQSPHRIPLYMFQLHYSFYYGVRHEVSMTKVSDYLAIPEQLSVEA